ncbi:hypothetical protein M127_5706 [Bacteroides fragilis str. S6L5]|nr:hypothetical protein M127_5706 [Bacteroides fragilis str. S6L5]
MLKSRAPIGGVFNGAKGGRLDWDIVVAGIVFVACTVII